MRHSRVLGGFVALWLLVACSDQAGKPSTDEKAAPRPTAPPPPAQVPELPQTAERDRDGNKLDDVLDQQLASVAGDARLAGETTSLQVILSTPVQQSDLDDFEADGGKVRYVFRELSYGWTGSIARGKLPALSARLGSKLHLVAAPRATQPFMDEATRTGRIRGIWAASFAGSASGYSGNSNITIAVLDTGVDSSHTDLTGRMQGWKDYTGDAAVSARDVGGHGTHVASIAVGSGAAFGAATASLKFTQSGNLTGIPVGSFVASTLHTPAYLGSGAALSASASATFLGGGSTTLHALFAPDGSNSFTSFGNVSGGSPLALSNQNGGSVGKLYQGGLVQANPASVTNFAVSNTVASYPGVGDGFNALRGVAPTCKWFGGKVFTDAGAGNSFDIEEGLDDIVARKVTDNIKIANLSLGVTGSGTDTVMRAKVNATVDAGLVVVVAAGNDGPSNTIGDPGRASKVITVGAANDVNELTTYTSIGALSPGADEDTKPDVLAPGGSAFRSGILAADTNTADGNLASFSDLVANDYSNLQGTSMATPFVSGSLALMIDALQQSGTSWSFGSSAQPLFLKMLLAASATELNIAREQGVGNSPTLGRASTPKDRFEGYGIINPDAAIEAMLQTFVSPLNGSVSNTAPARLEWERRAWGRKLSLVNGATVILNLAVPSTADFDIYLYAGSGDAKGNPVLRASSVNAGTDTDETISFTSAATETAYVFVKRVSGFGAFSVTGSAVSHCGDGDLDTGELCDPAMAGSTTCCTATCGIVSNGTSCSDGNACTKADTCQAGSCSAGTAVVCAASDQCHDAGTCDTGTGACSDPKKADGESCNDANKCTQTDTCQAGACAGKNPVVCAALDQCHDAGSCAPATGVCSNPSKTNGVGCDDGDKCTKTDTCQAGACTGGAGVVCATLDQCHDVGVCSPATGVCSNPQKANGASCDDGNRCTKTDTCVAGACSGANTVACAAADQCHVAGSCDATTGVCSNPPKVDGSACNDGNFCTQTDGCVAGVCTGGAPVVCSAVDDCHDAGVCDPASGLCSAPIAAPGTACDDADGCTLGDACDAGVCKSSGSVTCPLPDACHEAGICQAATGDCSYAPQADGTPCGLQGGCQAGGCVEPNPGAGGAGGETSAGGAASDGGAVSDGGAAEAGGAPGVAGAANAGGGAGGSLQQAGSSSTAGVATTAGAGNGMGALAGAPDVEPAAGAAPITSAANSHDSSGCGCELPGRRRSPSWPALALLVAAGVLGRVRRRAA